MAALEVSARALQNELIMTYVRHPQLLEDLWTIMQKAFDDIAAAAKDPMFPGACRPPWEACGNKCCPPAKPVGWDPEC